MALTAIPIWQNDTPYLDFLLKYSDTDENGNAILSAHNLTGATVKFTLAEKADGTVVINEAAMSIVGDATLGRVRYTVQTGDFDTPGDYYCQIEVTFSDGRIITFPKEEYLPIIIGAELS